MIGKTFRVGSYIYRKIALKRVELFGVCTLSSIKHKHQKDITNNREGLLQKTVVVHILFLSVMAIVFMPAPYIGIQGSYNAANQAAHYYGIAPINVFNKTDLRMAENWFTLESIEFSEIVPLLNVKGERLDFHKSDRIYFGGTLLVRRSMIYSDTCAVESHKGLMIYFSMVYLNYKNSPDGNYNFRYRQYHQEIPNNENLIAGVYRQHEIEIRCEANLGLSYKS
jgi:hypothetical protein